MPDYDAIIIGTGQAGPSLARRAAAHGWRVAIVEQGPFGGTCVNTGCTPTKTLVASAYAAHLARRGGEFGVVVPGPVSIDWPRVKARKDAVVAASRSAVERSLRQADNVTVHTGHARLASPHEVTIGDETIGGARIFLNVGGQPSIPPVPGIGAIACLTSSTVMDLDRVPERLVVLGGSYVGLEFGQMFRRFGAEVSILETAPRLIAREDADISDWVRRILEAEGIGVSLGVAGLSFEKRPHGFAANFEGGSVEGTHLLVATGRRPNTDALGLEKAGLAADAHGFVPTDDALRTAVPHIWALGDCNGRGAFTHTSYNDAEIVGANLFDGAQRSVRDRITAYALYTDPPLGRAGMTEAQARDGGRPVLTASMQMEDVSRAYEKSETLGMMKVVADPATQQILGAAILGTGGDEAIHCILDAMYAKMPYPALQRAMHIHPTVAEFIPTLLEDLK